MKEIIIQNFRCYEKQSVKFKPSINLLVGDNATGKTSILQACKYVLSAFFSGFSDENTQWKSPGVNDFRHITNAEGIIMQELPINISFDVTDIIGIQNVFEESQPSLFDFVEEQKSLNTIVKNSKKNSRPLVSELKVYKEYASNLMNNYFEGEKQTKALPLFANFSTEDIHATRKIDSGRFLSYSQKPSFGYFECIEGDGFFPYWLKRMLVLKEAAKNMEEVQIVKAAVSNALGSEGCNIISSLEVRPLKNKVYFKFVDGREVSSEYLSDGYKRLISIVVDIAFRCALLNRGVFGQEACQKTKGTVLIDEIDLHLHPSLQSSILQGLCNAFPNIQFIVSSHAPMVMSGVETNEYNEVFKLGVINGKEYTIEAINTYGMDLSMISKVILDQTPRVEIVEQKLGKLFDLIDQEKLDEAKQSLQEMQNKFGDKLPDLVEAEMMLHGLSFEDNEKDI